LGRSDRRVLSHPCDQSHPYPARLHPRFPGQRSVIQPHNPALLRAYESSVFADGSFTREQPEVRQAGNLVLQQFELLIQGRFLDFSVFCQVRISETEELLDEHAASLAVKLLPLRPDGMNDVRTIEQALNLFLDRSTKDRTQSITGFLEATAGEFRRAVGACLSGFQVELDQMMEGVRAILYLSSKKSEERGLSHLMLTKVAGEIQNRAIELQQKKAVPMKRQNLFSFAFCSVRWKWGVPKCVAKKELKDSLIAEYQCVLQHFVEARTCVLRVSLESLILLPISVGRVKSIKIGKIAMFFVHQGQCAIDIFTKSAKNYRVKFEEKDFPNFIQIIESIDSKYPDTGLLHSERTNIDRAAARWQCGELSNFDYIMRMNIVSGRSFRDSYHHPIAPPVLKTFADMTDVIDNYSHLKYQPLPHKFQSLETDFVGHQSSIVPKNEKLPQWAANRFDFVYKSRKLLESPIITSRLPEWINRAFGFKADNCPSLLRVFSKPHPSQDHLPGQSPSIEYKIELASGIKYAKLFSAKQNRTKFGIITSQSQFYSVVLEYQGNKLECRHDLLATIDAKTDDLVFSQSALACAYSRSDSIVFFLQAEGTMERIPFFSRTSLFVGSGRSILYSPDGFGIFRLAMQRRRGFPVVYVCHSERKISLLTASRAHQTLAFATVDGAVVVHDAKNGTFLSQFETMEEITQLLITEGWCFVLACSAKTAFVFSVNGEFIKKQGLQLPLCRVFAHIAFGPFDFVSFVTQSNEIGVCEALFPQEQTVLWKAQFDVVNILYDPRHRTLIVCGGNGQIRVYPWKEELLH
jgi:hypothetical protein